MAKAILKPGADPIEVAEELKKYGFTIGQKLPNRQMVVYIKPNKIALSELLDNLQKIEQYDNPQKAFNTILYGWRVTRRKQTTEWLHELRKRNFISTLLAEDFARYCLQDNWQKMMPN